MPNPVQVVGFSASENHLQYDEIRRDQSLGQASSSGDTTEVFQHNESLLPHLPAKN